MTRGLFGLLGRLLGGSRGALGLLATDERARFSESAILQVVSVVGLADGSAQLAEHASRTAADLELNGVQALGWLVSSYRWKQKRVNTAAH